MTRLTNILTSVALATALTPVVANATTMIPMGRVQIEAHKAVSGPLPEALRIADTAATYGQATVQSGATNQLYPDSSGG